MNVKLLKTWQSCRNVLILGFIKEHLKTKQAEDEAVVIDAAVLNVRKKEHEKLEKKSVKVTAVL